MKIAKHLWPALRLAEEGGRSDLLGIDGWLDGDTVQIKYDRTSEHTSNICHEIYEKSAGRTDQWWRPSPHSAKWYIFTNDSWAIKVSLNQLAEWEIGRKLQSTNRGGTSLGYFVPVKELVHTDTPAGSPGVGVPPGFEVRWHKGTI